MKQHLLTAGLLAALLSCLPGQAAPSLRGMETGEDLRLGPVLTTGLPFGLPEPGDRQYYMLSLQGESPNHGFSRIFLRVISLYELLDLPQVGSSPATQVRFHHQFASLGFESPLYYELTGEHNWELGWSAAFTLARVTFKQKDKPAATGLTSIFSDYPEIQPATLGAQLKTNPAQADTQFLGGELGFYARMYHLYPFVPYASVRANLGSYFNAASMIKGVTPQASPPPPGQTAVTGTPQRTYESGFKIFPVATAGLDFHIAGRGLIGIEASLWNWDWDRLAQDTTLFLAFKAGFLF